jgi:hypothetical protein
LGQLRSKNEPDHNFSAIRAAVLAFWSGSPIRHDFSIFIMVVVILMIAAMWAFPEAGVKKGDVKRAK